MKKYLAVLLFILLPLTWVWATGEVTKDVVSPDQQEAEWQPAYGEKGELLNPPPAVQMYRNSTPGEYPDPPVISTVLLSEDFEDVAWGDPDNPPPGWAVSDSGGEGTANWHLQDWFKNYYTTWADTNARIYYSGGYTEINFDEWMISPEVILPGGATACSLTWKNYYNDDGAGKDTAYVKITTDGGSNWINLVVWDQDHMTSPYLETLDITLYAGNTIQIAYVLQCNTGSQYDIYEWKIDKVNIWADAANLLNEEFNNWGPGGDNPPAGWTILDNGTPKPPQGVWNYNDWHDYTRWGSKTARIYYTSTYAEYQDEWMISPEFSISSAAICSLSMVERYFHSTATTPRYFNEDDHGYILITTDGGTTWNTVYDNTTTKGSTSSAITFAYDLSAYAGNTCKLAFNFVNSASGYDYWNFDDVLVTEQVLLTDDVSTLAINSPTVGISGYSHNVSAKVVNLGTNTATFQDSAKIDKLNKATLFFEDFSNPQGWTGASPPVNVAGTWAVLDSGSIPGTWDNNDWYGYYYSTWSDTIARVYYSPIEVQNEWLITPSLNFSGNTNLHLTFKQFYNDYTGTTDTGYVFGTTDSWATVETLAVYSGADYGSSSSPDFPDIDISSWADNQSSVNIAFVYKANDDLYWYLDKVEVYATLTPTVDYISGESVVSLTSLETRDIDYTATWDNPTAGDYQITSWTNLTGDGDNSNDTVAANLTVYEHYETGGPDANSYSWASDKDGGGGDPYSWIDITTSGTPITWDYSSLENKYTYGIPLGFSFTFYDVAYDRIYIGSNGYASFDTITSSSSSNYHLPSTLGQDNILALLWDDLSDESGGIAYYYTNNADTFIISYENWDFDIDLDQRIDMQLILTASDRGIKYQYKEVGPVITLSHSIGIEDDPGNVGLEFIYNGNPMGNIAMSGLAITFSYNPPAIDAALSSIDEPADGSVVFNGTTVTPTVTVLNNSDADYAIPVTYLITDGTTGDTVYNQSEITALVTGGGGTLQHAFTVTWNADPDGDYDVEAYTSLAGDANPANDTEISDFVVASHYGTGGPDDFGYRWIDNSGITAEDPPVFAYIDLSADPLADTAGAGTGNYGVFPIGFDFDFYGNTYDSVNIKAYGYVSFGTATYSTSNDCPIPSSTTPDDPMIMVFWDYPYVNPTYDGACIYRTFGTTPDRYMVIQYHNYRRSSYLMEFEMILHENGNIVYQYQDVDEAGSWGQGQSASIGLQSENVGTRSGLSYLCGTGTPDRPGNILTDGLAIKWYKPVYGHDIVVDQFNVPGPSGIANVAFTPDVQFSNNGNNDETNVSVNLTINPGGYSDAQLIAVLDSGTSVSQQFAQFTPTTTGSYTLIATSALAGDEDPTSDTLTLTFTAFDDLIDFEADDGGLTGSGDWQWGAPNNPEGPANAFSGANVWATNLSGDYTNTLSTLEFDLAVGSTNPSIGVAHWYDTEARWDGGNFGVSADGGSTWITVSPDIGYDDSTRSANPLDPDSIFTGHGQKFWDVVNFDLTAFAGTNIRARFAFGADGSVYYPGWHIDDLAFIDCQIAEGAIAGTVTDNVADLPVAGAIVEANGTVRDTTDVLGEYSFDIGPGEVVMVISKMGYNTDTDTVTVVNGQTTTHDVVLTAPFGSIDTTPIVENVAPGDTAVYSRFLHNTGDGELSYSVSLNFSPAPMGIGEIGGFDIRTNSVSEKISNAGRNDNSTDYAPFSYSGGNLPVITDFMDSVFVAILDSSIDTQFLGMEFDGEFFWVTGGGSSADPNKLYKLDSDGNLLMTYDQNGTSVWGWRDLAWDGQYLYGSDDGIIDQIDPATGDTTGVTINGPATTNRALAYNPDTDHFFTANFGSVIDEFGRDGTVYNTWANTKSIYGMAFDNLTEGGPYLWIFSQDGPGVDTLLEISQFEIATGTYTGVSWQGSVPDGYLGGIAGGACFTTEWDASIGALFVLGQGDPMDFIYGYEIAVNETWLTVASGGSGSVTPGDSAEIVFMVDFRDPSIVADSTYNAEANVNDNSVSPTHVIPFSITASAGGCDYVVGDVNGSDSYNGLDITYGVAYFKGGPDPHCPFGSCPIPPCDAFFYCGDVNASCTYNGLDITYGVAYFKGGPGPLPCPSCPPIGGPASIKGNEIKPSVQPSNEFKSVTQPNLDTKSKTKKGTSRKR